MTTLDFLDLSGHSMGTTWSLRAGQGIMPEGKVRRAVHHAIEAALNNIVAQMSHWEPDSLLSRINRAPAGWYQVPPEFFSVVSCAADIARKTHGAYDPTVGELVQLWGFGAQGKISQAAQAAQAAQTAQTAQPPAPQHIASALARAGWEKLHLNADHRAVWQPGGLSLDFSAIAKGYGVDAMADVLARGGFTDYLVELGGELRASGHRPDGKPWRVQIEGPEGNAGLPIVLRNLAIATSGDTRRYFVHEGRRYAHTVDPRTGRALHNDLASVSVVHPQCMVADALSTALICMGWEAGQAYAHEHDISALFMRRCGDDIAVEWTDAFFRQAHPDAGPAPAVLPA